MDLKLDGEGIGVLVFYAATERKTADEMYRMLGLHSGQTVYDLGCGEGCLLDPTKDFGVNGVGFEINYKRAWTAEERMRANNLPVKIINDDFTKKKYWHHQNGGPIQEFQIVNADAVLLYLSDHGNDVVASLLKRELKPGTKIVSGSFRFPDWWPASKYVDLGVKGLYLYEV